VRSLYFTGFMPKISYRILNKLFVPLTRRGTGVKKEKLPGVGELLGK